MSDDLRFHPQIPFDLAEAITYYESISASLADRFRDSVSNVLEQIREFPEMCSVVFDDVRIARTGVFPYIIQYRIQNSIPCILAVLNGLHLRPFATRKSPRLVRVN